MFYVSTIMNDDQSEESVSADSADTQPVPEPSLNADLRSPKPFPGFWQAIGLLLLFLVLLRLLGIALSILPLGRNPMATAVWVLMATGVVLLLGYAISHASFREVFPFRAVPISAMFSLLLAVFGLYLLLGQIGALLARLLPPSPSFTGRMGDLIGGRQSFWGSLIAGVFLMPAGEELLYRGLLLHGFLNRYGAKIAIVLSAFLFALMHGNLWQFPTALCYGIFLAWCCVRARSLVPCIFAHAANNSFSFTLLAIQNEAPARASSGTAQIALSAYLYWAVVGLILAAMGIYLAKRCFDRADLKAGTVDTLR